VSNYSAAVLALSPKRYYRLGETSGTAANDLGSDAQNGTIQAAGTGVTLNQASLIPSDAANASMLFTPASAGYITLPTTGLPTGASAWSIVAWVKMPATLPSGFPTIFCFGTASTNKMAILMYRASSTVIEVDDWSGTVLTWGTAPVANGVYFLAATYDGTILRLYVNGALVNSVAKTFAITAGSAQIGNDSTADYWSGIIDEVAFFGSALTLAQIQSLYAAARARTVPATAALSGTQTRTVPTTAALIGTLTRPAPATASLSIISPSRSTPTSAALIATSSRTISTSGALQASGIRTISTSGALQATTTRTIPATAALISSRTRAMPASTALLNVLIRTTPASVALFSTSILAQDTFAGRSVSGSSTVSFGTASDGSAWQAPLWATLLTTGVSGGEGYLMSSSGGAAGGAAFLGSVALRDVDLTCRFKFGTVSGNPLFQLCFRGKDANNYTDIAINATTGALTLERWSSGNNASFAMGTFGALTAGTFYHLRIQSDGSTCRAKVWQDGSSEPGTFAYSATDTFLASQIAGFFGVGITNVTATTQATGVQFDNLIASLVYLNQQLYVTPTGNDTTGNGSAGSPYLTLQRGFDAISPGGTLHVAAGTYTQASGVILLARASGTADKRITLQSDTKWAAKITGTNSFTIFECDGSYVDILGFDVSATDNICSYGIVAKGNFCSVQRCYCHDILAVNNGNIGGAGISGQNSGNNYISGPVDVIGNFITRIGQDGTNTNAPYVHAIYMSCQGGNIWNNLVAGCGGSAVSLGHGASGLHVDNNTFVGCLNGGIALWSGWPTEGPGPNDYTTITNNILAHNIGTANGYPVYTPGIWEDGANVGPHNTYANNLLFDNIVSTQAGWVGLQYQFDSGGVLTNTVFADPQFVNDQKDGSGDYHLKSASPAINAGGTTSAPTIDYDGLTRPLLGASIDIGAYEATAVASFIPRALDSLFVITTNTRILAASGTLSTTSQRTIGATAALIGGRVIPMSAALQATGSRIVPTTVALIGTFARTSAASGALQVSAARILSATSALSATKTRSVPGQGALLSTGTRTVGASVALAFTNTRTVSSVQVALLTMNVRTVPTTGAMLAASIRMVPATGAVLKQASRSIPASAPLSITRIIPTAVALGWTITRTIPASAAFAWTMTRQVPTTGALLSTSIRTVPATGALMQQGITRTISATGALQVTLTRTITESAALLRQFSRAMGTSAALLSTTSRSVGASSALLSSASRSVGASSALLSTRTRTMTADVALALTGTATRTVPASGALLATTSRSVGASVAVGLSNVTRTVPATAAILRQANRVIGASTPLQVTGSRQVAVEASLSSQASRSIPGNAVLIATLTRSSGATVVLIATLSRTLGTSAALTLPGVKFRDIPCSASLSGGSRVIPATVALRGTRTRSIPCTTSISLSFEGLQIGIPASAALQSTSIRFVVCTVALLASNASLRFRSGVADVRVRSGQSDVRVRSETVIVTVS
jgi:hypothetical protein